MIARIRTRLTFANVVSVIALFVALGGTSVAAVTLVRNSVKSKHVAANAITSPKVKDASLLAQDFGPGELPRGEEGEKGDTGAPGSPGTPGAPGTPGTPGTPGSPAASWVAGNAGEPLVSQSGGSGTSAYSPMGTSSPAGNFGSRTQLSPNATIVVRDLVVSQDTPPGAGGQIQYKLVDVTDGKVVLMDCTIAGTAKSCNTGSEAVTVSPASKLSIEVSRIGPTAATFAGWGFRATTP